MCNISGPPYVAVNCQSVPSGRYITSIFSSTYSFGNHAGSENSVTPLASSAFRKRVLMTVPAQRNRPIVSGRRFRRIGRVGVAVALTIICIMSGMLVTQAAGVDILGAVAQWTSDMFSLGTIRSSGGVDMPVNAGVSQPDSEDSPSSVAHAAVLLLVFSSK